ncbi:hypothetical protein D9758_009561 [Tetrapyrgos nigripes]|uniref:ubiquitinyl hydrolase 1 n=1 Tax=Tetrapyrgos nigripes TaxID=182062 RepID=A0A8H5GCU5_9AGAR|nr:hypothetical protein D9758_009561 [Tetrapyrgos nigripes]
MSRYTRPQVEYAIHHVFLPPKLPAEFDQCTEFDFALAGIVADSARDFRTKLGSASPGYQKWHPLTRTLGNFKTTQKADTMDQKELKRILSDLLPGDTVALFIRAQNAGVVLHVFERPRHANNPNGPKDIKVVFESFELSPPASKVLSVSGKLVCSYPGPAIEIDKGPFDHDDFVNELANFLADMNNEPFFDESVRERKTSLNVVDNEDTVDPTYITTLLTGIFRGCSGVSAKVKRITKRIGDDAVGKGGKNNKPWRRSSVWLLLRVVLQTTLMSNRFADYDYEEGEGEQPMQVDGAKPTHWMYKSFMVWLHASILDIALKQNRDTSFDSDVLRTMQAKTSRRLAKLALMGPSIPEFLTTYVHSVLDATTSTLQSRWARIQQKYITPPSVIECPWNPPQLNIELDTDLRLENSSLAISMALNPNAPQPTTLPTFTPSEHRRLRDLVDEAQNGRGFSRLSSSVLKDAFTNDTVIALSDFEVLVGRGALETWLKPYLSPNVNIAHKETASSHLWTCMRTYFSSATTAYLSNPEDQSMMVLTLLDIWVALDKLACAAYPLLQSYHPEVPLDKGETGKALVRHLLLRKAVDLARLKKIDEYIRMRHHKAKYEISVFSDKSSSQSFYSKFYDSPAGVTAGMHNLRGQIEREADAARKVVLKELQDKMAERSDLLRRIGQMNHLHDEEHTRYEYRGRGAKRRRVVLGYNCAKCTLERKVESLAVSTHEWPLPEDEGEVKRVVFELVIPKVFAKWRAGTCLLLFEMGTNEEMQKELTKGSGSKHPSAVLSTCDELSGYCQPADDLGILTLASTNPPARGYNSRTKRLPITSAEVCLPSGYRWKGWDGRKKVWLYSEAAPSNIFQEADTSRFGTLYLDTTKPSLYAQAKLQYAISKTTHTSNQVLSCQSHCPPELSLHEFSAFGTLRAGGRVQWMNLIREIHSTGSGLTWASEEVGILVRMLIWQVGPFAVDSSSGCRQTAGLEWHTELYQLGFGKIVLNETGMLLRKVQGNWKEIVTVRTIVYIVARLLASTPHEEVQNGCLELLRNARGVVWEWIGQLDGKMQDIGEVFVRAFQMKVCEMAAVCRSTFDADDCKEDGTGSGYLPSLLSTVEDVAIFVRCGILVHDNTPHDINSDKSDVSPDLKKLLRRDQRLAHAAEARLKFLINDNAAGFGIGMTVGKEGLDEALKKIWTSYRPGTGWLNMTDPDERWVYCRTDAGSNGSDTTGMGTVGQMVHLDLLKGRLLVNGKPLGRLPMEIVKHELYIRTFGDKKVLDVIPAQLRGMEFATRSLINGYQVFFGMREEGDLVIRAIRDDKVFELIPHHNFEGDLPLRFVQDYTHWVDLSNGEVELRPLQSMWERSPSNWVIHFLQSPRVCKDPNRTMIDVHSLTFEMVQATLKPLERKEYLTVTCSNDFNPSSLAVDLPRYRLAFHRNDKDELESRNFPGMIVDHDDQSFGALVGLQNRLVLRPNNRSLAGARRKVLVPYGNVEISPYLDDHVTVTIDNKDDRIIRFADYVVDVEQGCLTGNTSLRSRLFLIYLLAVTSHCLPDPLTKVTGVEEALSEFHTAACMSSRELTEEDMDLLVKIGKLTPSRFGVPPSCPKVQSITWHPSLPPLSQHDAFIVRAKEIIASAEHQRVFDDEAKPQSEQNMKGKDKKDGLPARNHHVDSRAAARNAVYYPSDFAGAPQRRTYDLSYSSRDTQLLLETVVCSAASNVFLGPTYCLADKPRPLHHLFKRWARLRQPSKSFRLSYNRGWFSLNFADSWLSIYEKCIKSGSRDRKKYRLLFSLSAMVFANPQHSCFVAPIVFSFWDQTLRQQHVPHSVEFLFDLDQGIAPTDLKLASLITPAALPAEATPSWNLERLADEEDRDYDIRRRQHYHRRCKDFSVLLNNFFLGQWGDFMTHRLDITFNPNVSRSYYRVESLIANVQNYFNICNQNRLLINHARAVNSVFDTYFANTISYDVPEYDFQPCKDNVPSSSSSISLTGLLSRNAPALPQRDAQLWGNPDDFRNGDPPAESAKLKKLLNTMSDSSLEVRKAYARDLHESYNNLTSIPSLPSAPNIPFSVQELLVQKELCAERYQSFLDVVVAALSPTTSSEKAIAKGGNWPRLTLRSVLRLLAYPRNAQLTQEWKVALTLLARDTLEYQRAIRLLAYAQQGKREDFFRELDTHTFDMTVALQYLDWTLIQIEGNFLARPLQLRVAQEMIAPSSGQNTVLQLNMGEGKSSVIVPLVAAALADGKKLVRVVVLKPLAGQMFQLLVERLSSLANRRIFYMPFSRKIRVGAEQVAEIQKSYETCMKEGGIWIVQPEHILSFKLMGIDRCLVSNNLADRSVAESLAKSQRWLDMHSRDVLDESDEILHIRYQLVYTVGQQQPLELHPDRWTIMEELYKFVSWHIVDVKSQNRNGVDLQSGPSGSFSPVRIIDTKAGRELIKLVVDDVFSGRLSSFNVRFLPETVQVLARAFVENPKVELEVVEELKEYCGRGNDWKHLLLLRGLIAHGILLYSLKARQYRVDYGLDLSRSLLAVPYRAKDVPSIRAEFGHPDVALALTCLTYYYQGLDSAQLKICFDLLFKLDNPPLEYESWVDDDEAIPIHLRTLNGVNTDDADQHVNFIIPLFGKRKTVIDFYLSQVVFPKAAKEFPFKLSTSSWDLAEAKPRHLTTGFSGTNDNRFLLPTSISQRDPLQQSGTNAKVLTYLLQKENNHYHCAALPDGGRLPVVQFLEFMSQKTANQVVQVLLDVGAQMLDLKNEELAKEWLRLRPEMLACQLDHCLVYLDDAHTRGTDLKLPINSRAAVTLGPKVTKDRLIQGAMRMRKLGYGQSVIFFAPSEIDRNIKTFRPKMRIQGQLRATPASHPIHVEDILRWTIFETCRDIQHHLPHWAEQGLDYLRRRQAWEEFSNEIVAADESEEEEITPNIDILQKVWDWSGTTGVGGGDANLRQGVFSVPELRERLKSLGVNEVADVDVDEEQEREVNHEIEQETEIERPLKVEPAKHHLSHGLPIFVETGVLPFNGTGPEYRKGFQAVYESIENVLRRVPLIGVEGKAVWSPGLYATKDFSTTISERDVVERGSADYLRPVAFLLTSNKYEPNGVVVILSPFEVHHLLPAIRRSKHVHLHVYSPRVTKDMLPLDDLRFYVVPQLPAEPWNPPRVNIISQLNLFAGQLYLGNYDVYLSLCRFLGLHNGEEEPMEIDDEPYPVQSDGFVRVGPHRESMGLKDCRFNESPVPFLQELIGLRRKGMGYLPTHLGRIVHGRLLTADDFDY